jgi:riboflavin biosynthesis pyrimidine reductase
VQQIYPGPGPAAAGDQLAVARLLASWYAYPDAAAPWVRANMVASADGATAIEGRSGGLGGPADRLLFRVLRGLADVILVGGGTARAERYGPARPAAGLPGLRAGRTATPPIAVVTGRLDLDPDAPLLTRAPADARTIVLTTESAPAAQRAALARHADVIVAGTDTVSPGRAIAALAGLGHTRILTEGGPGLLAQIAAAGLLDELCLTISPVLAGGPGGRVLAASPALPAAGAPLRLAHVLADDGFLFCRYLSHHRD